VLGIVLDTRLTERKRPQKKPVRQATKDYRNSEKNRENNKTIDKGKKTNNVSTGENQQSSSLKGEQGTRTTARVSGPSTYDDVSKMQGSANIQEDDSKSAISNIQKRDPIKDEVSVHRKSQVATYLQPADPIATLQETAITGESRETGFHEKRSSFGDNPFMSGMTSWQSDMINWIGIYKAFSENVAKMAREYWMTPFWMPRRSGYKTNDKVKAE
jgi:hypothetical protein